MPSATTGTARTMSTLDVQLGRLRRAVAPYPVVKDIRVTTKFPHSMRIEVIENVAVGAIDIGGQKVAVAPDGTLMRDVAVSPSLPTIPVSLAPWKLGMTGTPYAVLAVVLGLVYLAYTIRFAGILRARSETESRMLARDLLKVSVLYLPLLFTALMLCANGKH